ncbi:hypothetical protein [Streptomyces yaizuensis]|uniref:CopG family transcriptional regulator n=1 Tax=Streptomyces yaizuensis TaxID=2989713 RepID=A0ABQ5NY49_9ACTN|nr:hypothetical protein [Streptomyces sp. YSPA8]GLF95299.1 hypothetical protein SYYSPA8_13400 [Streptomyces sp. YSPA8]
MSEQNATRWTVRHEQRVEVPATVEGIRAALPEDERQRFEMELGRATAETVADVVRHWVLNLASGPEDEDEFARLEAENRGAA